MRRRFLAAVLKGKFADRRLEPGGVGLCSQVTSDRTIKPTRAPYLGNEFLERPFASDAGSVLALLRVGLQSSRVISSKHRHDLNVPLAQPTLLLLGAVDSIEC